jgi:hypothetical protein
MFGKPFWLLFIAVGVGVCISLSAIGSEVRDGLVGVVAGIAVTSVALLGGDVEVSMAVEDVDTEAWEVLITETAPPVDVEKVD